MRTFFPCRNTFIFYFFTTIHTTPNSSAEHHLTNLWLALFTSSLYGSISSGSVNTGALTILALTAKSARAKVLQSSRGFQRSGAREAAACLTFDNLCAFAVRSNVQWTVLRRTAPRQQFFIFRVVVSYCMLCICTVSREGLEDFGMLSRCFGMKICCVVLMASGTPWGIMIIFLNWKKIDFWIIIISFNPQALDKHSMYGFHGEKHLEEKNIYWMPIVNMQAWTLILSCNITSHHKVADIPSIYRGYYTAQYCACRPNIFLEWYVGQTEWVILSRGRG